MDIFDEIPRGQLPIIILSTLFECDKYGYEIINDIKQKSDGKLVIKQPSLYSSLRRMEEQGLISSYWRDSELGGRRHYYSITDYGKKYADKWQTDFVSTQNSFNKLLNKNGKPETKKAEEPNQTDTFIQYDLFSNPTFISKPSVEVFDSLKPDEPTSSGFSLDSVQIQPNDNIITEYDSDKMNKKFNDIEMTNLKQEIKQLKNNSNSFTSSYVNSQSQVSINDDEISLESNIDLSNELAESELPTIIQSTNFNEEEQSSTIDLDELIKNRQTKKEEPASDAVFLDSSERYEDVKTPSQEEQVSKEQPKDDAVYITEKPDPDSLPKVKKIAPSRFELHSYDKLPKKLAEDKIDTLYSQGQTEDVYYEPLFNEEFVYSQENQPKPDAQVEEEYVDESQTSNFNQLKNYYSKNGISFLSYRKNSTSNKKELSLFKHNKMKLISSIIFLLWTVIETVSLYFAFKDSQIGCHFFFFLPSIFCLAYTIYCLVSYNKNKTKISNKMFFSLKYFGIMTLIALLSFMVIWAINLLCGMTFANTQEFGVTFGYLSILLINFPIFYVVELVVSKLSIVKC